MGLVECTYIVAAQDARVLAWDPTRVTLEVDTGPCVYLRNNVKGYVEGSVACRSLFKQADNVGIFEGFRREVWHARRVTVRVSKRCAEALERYAASARIQVKCSINLLVSDGLISMDEMRAIIAAIKKQITENAPPLAMETIH